jgi:hypothetical protein
MPMIRKRSKNILKNTFAVGKALESVDKEINLGLGNRKGKGVLESSNQVRTPFKCKRLVKARDEMKRI